MTNLDHYPTPIRLNGAVHWVIWVPDSDGHANDFVLADGARALSFASVDELSTYCLRKGRNVVEEEPKLHDLDSVQAWLEDGGDPDPAGLLAAWNIAGDFARGVGIEFSDRSEIRDALYDKLFWANNLPAVTPPGERFDPEWADDEVLELRATLREAVSLVASALDRG